MSEWLAFMVKLIRKNKNKTQTLPTKRTVPQNFNAVDFL